MGLRADEGSPSGIRWFGASWHAPVCSPDRFMSTPVGWSCFRCLFEINEEHRGIAMGLAFGDGWSEVYEHLACFLADLGIEEIDLVTG